MNFLYVLASTATPSDPALKPGLDETAVTPGILGFLFTLFIAVAVILLILDMTRRPRRVRYRAQLRGEVMEAEGIPLERTDDGEGPDAPRTGPVRPGPAG